ncbi:unnamed protein product [Darwinula stevensoni]|uniref:Follistatin-related protein 5 n=1 Tax=Darwinula stevensoni TaxID=69355 RepID=A0A7R9FP41_9CRUS|nr:unnamed protein product [Darwinula stevensoni]CAG0897541.1 unnamed protein product [Darwinula stevensoni]
MKRTRRHVNQIPPPFFDEAHHQGDGLDLFPIVDDPRLLEIPSDPCARVYCGAGKECRLTVKGEPECICKEVCPAHIKPVCGNDGILYPNHCELHRTACRESRHIAINRKGPCKEKSSNDQTTHEVTEDVSTTTSSLVLNKHKYPVATSQSPVKSWPKEDSHEYVMVDNIENNMVEIATPANQECSPMQYEIMKDNLLLYNHKHLIGSDESSEADQLLSIMFAHYDANGDGIINSQELASASAMEDLGTLSSGCDLPDLIRFEDLNMDGSVNINEFYDAFSKLYSISVVSLDKALETNEILAVVGDNLEIRCDVTGSPVPPIVWKRNGVNLASLADPSLQVFRDGSLYISHVQLVHGGRYICHAEKNEDVIQTHLLNISSLPSVMVEPVIQSRSPGESARMECWVGGHPPPQVEWLKNDDPVHVSPEATFQVVGEGRELILEGVDYADTGAYMCQARNVGGLHRAISSLVIQENPRSVSTKTRDLLAVFHGDGIGIYNSRSCHVKHVIQGTDVIPGSQSYVCPDAITRPGSCVWGSAVNVRNLYFYASQPQLNRVLVISLDQMEVVDVLATNSIPVEVYYMESQDQVWIVSWIGEEDGGNKSLGVVVNASQKGPRSLQRLDSMPIYRLFLPPPQGLGVSWGHGYVSRKGELGLYKLDLITLKFVLKVDLSPYKCIPNQVAFISRNGQLVIECQDAESGKGTGQLLMDYMTETILQFKASAPGTPHVSPDSLHVVNLHREPSNSILLAVHKVTETGLEFQFDVRTTLNVSEVEFFPSREHHTYDLFASSVQRPEILFLNMESGHVEMVVGIGEVPDPLYPSARGAVRSLAAAPLFSPHLATGSRDAVFLATAHDKSISCEIGSLVRPHPLVWLRPDSEPTED